MKKLLASLSFALLLLTGCSQIGVASKEATEAVQNLTNEALRIKNSAEATATQVKSAYESVNNAAQAAQDAVQAVNQATDSIQAIGNNDPSLSSED